MNTHMQDHLKAIDCSRGVLQSPMVILCRSMLQNYEHCHPGPSKKYDYS